MPHARRAAPQGPAALTVKRQAILANGLGHCAAC